MVKSLQDHCIKTITVSLLDDSLLEEDYNEHILPEHIEKELDSFKKNFAYTNIKYFSDPLPEFYYNTKFDEAFDAKKIKFLSNHSIQPINDNYYSVYKYSSGVFSQIFISLYKRECLRWTRKNKTMDFIIIKQSEL